MRPPTSPLNTPRHRETSPSFERQRAMRDNAILQHTDPCWDLLRQRRARREFGDDPSAAHGRGASTVERYAG